VLHVLVVLFIVAGLALILAGGVLQWRWVRRRWLRVLHLVAIGVVVLQAWLGRLCPLTIWELQLRAQAGDTTYTGSFIAHWLGELLYYNAPGWVFTLGYSLFALLVLWSWFKVRPL
jgi:hypothetical protein